ncbi:MAG: hypothetical protein NVV70_16745 [Cellulomonas sp.]|nr:hypothetical protein [Cellulomonas sp.]MCR6649694.1 hypothetical protein [Cellulomonas sp.]
MPTITSNNPVVVVLVVLLILLLGGTGGGFVRSVLRDRRTGRVDDAALLDQVRSLVREEVKHVSDQLRAERRRTARLERRVEQLTETMRAHGVPVPAWPAFAGDDDSND